MTFFVVLKITAKAASVYLEDTDLLIFFVVILKSRIYFKYLNFGIYYYS